MQYDIFHCWKPNKDLIILGFERWGEVLKARYKVKDVRVWNKPLTRVNSILTPFGIKQLLPKSPKRHVGFLRKEEDVRAPLSFQVPGFISLSCFSCWSKRRHVQWNLRVLWVSHVECNSSSAFLPQATQSSQQRSFPDPATSHDLLFNFQNFYFWK